MRPFIPALAIALCAQVTAAEAHLQLIYPPQRTSAQKVGPCGGAARGDVTVFEPGQTITVMWKETIGHPGHFRISFDDDGQDDFVDPAHFRDFYSAPSVLLDNIDDTSCGTVSQASITLPNIECETCTLQVVQVMYDKTPYGDGNDLYYQCADIALRPGGGAPSEPEPGLANSVGDRCGCQAGTDASPQALLLVMLALGVATWRRRARAR